MNVSVNIYYEAVQEGYWFRALSSHLNSSRLIKMEEYGRNHPKIDELLAYDVPDIILTVNNYPKLGHEKTEEVPTGHNVGQRFARLVRAAEAGVMTVFFLPFAAMKHGRYANVCYINARLILAMLNVERIHDVPQLAINWPADEHHELIRGGAENKEVSALIDDLFLAGFDYRKVGEIKKLRKRMQVAYGEAIERNPRYQKPPPSVRIEKTAELLNHWSEEYGGFETPSYFTRRNESLVYRNEMTEGCCRREDPYTGTQFIYDYCYCGRYGPSKYDRQRNLVLDFPLIRRKVWLRLNPYDPLKKRRLWYIVPDLLVFRDGTVNPEDIISKERVSRSDISEWFSEETAS